ncbi:unnamed protein product, partial [Ascophyllum nodosum]
HHWSCGNQFHDGGAHAHQDRPDLLMVRISIHCKGRNVFTREQQASVFKAAYEELPVHVTTLRTLGNFK